MNDPEGYRKFVEKNSLRLKLRKLGSTLKLINLPHWIGQFIMFDLQNCKRNMFVISKFIISLNKLAAQDRRRRGCQEIAYVPTKHTGSQKTMPMYHVRAKI